MTEAQAKQRLLILTLVKLFGVACVFAGVMLMTKHTALITNINLRRIVAAVLMLNGLADMTIVPRLLRRNWNRQDSA
jgi:drug/metabolite transporter (DMT)-like permease